jgi:hypothetical protein
VRVQVEVWLLAVAVAGSPGLRERLHIENTKELDAKNTKREAQPAGDFQKVARVSDNP